MSATVSSSTDVNYWVDAKFCRYLVGSDKDRAIRYRDKFQPDGVVRKTTVVTTCVSEVVA
ncbi:hypothetical protein GS982_19980 [Rhodococcus hoagii]|nr:hypothetical protein [Prescottella equi]NKZ84482.1 hypothetical protein [Prescottella equi]